MTTDEIHFTHVTGARGRGVHARTVVPPRGGGGFTLIELMMALMMMTLVATAAMSLMMASGNTRKYVVNQTTAVSETELAFRRMVENIRSASAASVAGATEIDLVTQPDTSKAGNPVYNVKYYLFNSQLMEYDDRWGTNVLVDHVTGFTVTTAQSTKPTVFQVTLTVSPANSEQIVRQSYVTSRNF